MASVKDLKKRIGTVKNTQQTTRAMKMVSAAKLRRAQDAIQSQRPYAKQLGELIKLMTSLLDVPLKSPLISREREFGEDAGRKVLLVVVTSDRGLCGGFNGNVMKGAQRWVAANQSKYESIHLGFVGKKGYEFFKTRKFNLGPYFGEFGGKVTFAKAKKLSDALVEAYLSSQFDEVKFVFNEFQNAVSQRTTVEHFLPLREEGATELDESQDLKPLELAPMYIVRPTPAAVLEQLLNKHFATQAFRVLLESQAGEHGARMSAMENATKNAGEMIRKLTLQYNKQRQANITKELLEIIAGSESQKAS